MLSRAWQLSILGIAILSGCAFAPGSYLDTSSLQKSDVVTTDTDTYLVQDITPAVILRQRIADRRLDQERESHTVAPGDPRAFRYFVQPQDILSIIVWDHPELTAGGAAALDSTMGAPTTGGPSLGTPYSATIGSQPDPLGYTVSADGTIFFPYAGVVKVGGSSLDQIRQTISRALSKYIVNPQVNVRVLAFRSQQVQITGQVQTPGALAITDRPLTLADAIARSGGTTTSADYQRVRLIRNGKLSIVDAYAMLDKGDMSQNILLKGGDIVNVPDKIDSRVFVMGEVIKPLTLYMNRGTLTLADALTGASGVDNTSANVRQIYVIRGASENPTEPQIFQLDMSQPNSFLLAAQFQMQRLDVVYVGTSPGVRFNRVMGLITPTISTLFYTKQLTR